MNNNLNIAWNADSQIEVLTFDMAGETFAIEANLVREILDRIPETPVPGSAQMVSSVVNFRGKVIPIADMHEIFDLKKSGYERDARIIVIEINMDDEGCLVGIKADKVYEVTTLVRATVEAAPRVGMRWRQDFIRCLAKRGGDFIVVPHLQNVFSVGCSA